MARNRVPSVLAASFFQTSRRFLKGVAPANDFEQAVFPVFAAMTPEIRSLLACAVDSFESTPSDLRNAGLDPLITADPDRPVDTATLATALVREIGQRAAEGVFGNPLAVEQERPGLNRFFDPGSNETFQSQLLICQVNDLRTASFRPALAIGDYLPSEIQQHCELVLGEDGVIRQNCSVQTGDCPGNVLPDNVCARVPDVANDDAVVITGVNFMSTDMKVRLTARNGTATADVDAHVFGDVTTPLNEVVDGTTRIIQDCRVKDRLTFVVPADLPPGVYELQLLLPNTTGIAVFGPTIFSNTEYVNILPPSTARFQIVAERLRARQETSPQSFGSDEVAFTVLAAELLPDFTTGPVQRLDRRFDDVDSGDNRTVDAVVFTHAREIAGMAMGIVGFEVDSERAFNQQLRTFSDAFVDYVTRAWDKFRTELGAGAGAAIKALGLLKGALAVAIAAVLAIAIIAVVAYWAPADLIMDDAIGYSVIELTALTSANVPSPGFGHFDSPQGLRINLTPLEKGALTYREFREYVSDDEDSNYEVYFRYNRTA
ncbi:MAG TPA: hypothetical protein VFS08_02505 [Gemmatimonadaceae bacterium]|nr:hypothetical protein [Gemmatimonadaceae bacterium]